MKKLLVILCLFSLSTEIFSEEYVCSFSWNDQPIMSSYKREGSHFVRGSSRTPQVEKNYIIKETETMLFLHDQIDSSLDDSIFITIIDKKNKTFSHNYLILGKKESDGTEGKCLIRD
ncbi:hypothetical protein N9E88_04630 [Gammaproteobacteria bacterium]|nr:hypothetical protein [Gammaproteobacteria bacterium]MDA9834356.1 hypothetical protein [Gammaproteobacteria bacterium]MDA9979531.1 hypothetical protein [Gammaproteobacteria bacterium]MDC3371624.1 hypothetical protein [Gammaproteobacteria bacterium]